MGLDIKDIKKTLGSLDDKIPDSVKDDVVKKAKSLATKENLEKAKDAIEDIFDKDKDKNNKKKKK